MQQEAKKNSKKLVWLIVGVAVLLAAVAVALVFLLGPKETVQEQQQATMPQGGRPDLYWNVDRATYLSEEGGLSFSSREPGEDGLYHIRFSHNGELVEYTVADKKLVNVIENMQVMGLQLDESGNIIDAMDPVDFVTEAAKDLHVKTYKNGRLTLNSSVAMNGMEEVFKLGELAEIYNVTDSATVCGEPGEFQAMDKVLMYANGEGEITHVYITKRQPEAEVYWRADKKYNTSAAETTRVPDENGVYTIPFSYKGEIVQLQCKDKDLVSKIDRPIVYGAPFGLIFDKDGYIVDTVDAAVALRGTLLGSGYHITEMDGSTITCTYLLSGSQNGNTFTVDIGEDTEIYNCCIGGSADVIGEPTQLQLMDRVMVYTDMEGNPLLVYVMYRMADSPMYYNIERKYSDAKQETTRVPDASGYYVFKMAVQGKQVTLRTRDKAIANKIDAVSYGLMGLKVNGDIIERFYTGYVVAGADSQSPATPKIIVNQTGVIVSFVAQGGKYDATTNLVTSSNVEVYDISGYPGTTIGEKAEIKPGDFVRLMADYGGNITHMYITERYTGYPVYYSTARYYGGAAKGTTRTPDAEGYYVFTLIADGKQITAKTKDKALADFIDLQSPTVVALKINSSGIITDAAPAQTNVQFGRKAAANGLYEKIEGGMLHFTLASTGKEYTTPIADDAVVYNMSNIYDKNRGEKTKLQKGDQIVAIRDDKLGKVVQVYVLQRKVDCELYYNKSVKYNSAKQETTRVPDADGYYVYELAVAGQLKTFKTKDKELANWIDSRGSTPFAATVKGDIIQQAFVVTAKLGLKSFAFSNYDFMDAGGGKCVLTCNIPGNANYGKTVEVKLAKNYKAYDVSGSGEFGAQVKLKVGDRIICYYNDAGEIEWFYIWYRSSRVKGVKGYCEHCQQTVTWIPYTGTAYTEDAHVYLTGDRSFAQCVVGTEKGKAEDQPELILDLNGKTLKPSGDRSFVVYGKLSVLDSVGGGKIVARSNDKATAAGAIMTSGSGTLNLYSGTLCGGTGTKASNGGVVYVGAGSTFNMYGGKVTGGTAVVGGNIYVGSESAFNMYGGTVDGDVAVAYTTAKVSLGGKAKIGMGSVTGLQLPAGYKLSLGEFTANTKITVEAAGVFTETVTNPDSYLSNFTSFDAAFPVFKADNALACGRVAKCEKCGEEVYWSRFTPGLLKNDAHLVLTDDITVDTASVVYANVVIDLNGHTLSTNGDRTISVEGGELSVQDTVGGGKIVGRNNETTGAAGAIMLYSSGKMNLYSGEIVAGTGKNASNGGNVFVGASCNFNMYGGKISGGTAQNGANVYGGAGSVINIYGGEIADGQATLGGNIYSEGTVILNKGTVTGGEATKGGNIYSASAVRLNGGLVTGGEAQNGGNIYVVGGAVNVQGGTIENGVATPDVAGTTITGGLGGNIYAETATVIVGAESGTVKATVTGGKAYRGGNIYSAKPTTTNKAVTVNVNGTVSNGEAVAVTGDSNSTKNAGGNIYSQNTMSVKGAVTGGKADDGGNIYNISWLGVYGTVSGGEAVRRGGNIFSAGTLEVFGGAMIENGEAVNGGNVAATVGVSVYANATVQNGTATTGKGGNIYMIITSAERKTLTVSGKVLGGTAATGGNGIAALDKTDIVISGGEVTGTLKPNGAGATITVSGAAKISDLSLSGQKIILGELTEGASITLAADGAFTEPNENAADYAKYFHPANAAPEVAAHAVDNALIFGIKRYCSKCEANVMWEEFSAAACTGEKHLMLLAPVTVTSQLASAATDNITIDLNGKTLTADTKSTGGRLVLLNGTMNIQDSVGGGKITSVAQLSRNGGTIGMSATGILNLYSGTLTMEETAQAGNGGGVVFVGDGTFNMFGGTIVGGKIGFGNGGVDCLGVNVNVRGGKFTMTGGTIDGSVKQPAGVQVLGGNIYGGPNSVITLSGGTVIGGEAIKGGNIYSVGTVIINDGATVSGGKATLGGNIYSKLAVRLNGGLVTGGQAQNGGNIYMELGAVNVQGGTIENGVATPVVDGTTITGGLGGNIYADNATVTVGAATGDVVATVSNGRAYTGGNIYSVMTGGTNKAVAVNKKGVVTLGETVAVTGDTSPNKHKGGNIYTKNTLSVRGEVSNGKAYDGGNIFHESWTDFYGTATGGQASNRGGNIFSNSTLMIHSGAVIENGRAVNGGNVMALKNVTVEQNATVQNGTATTGRGGNIYMVASTFTLTVNGKVLGGTAGTSGAGIAATSGVSIVVAGGEVTGALQPNVADVNITVSGAAKISKLVLPASCKITVGELTDGAEITVEASGVFTNDNANIANYKKYFKPAESITQVGNALSKG